METNREQIIKALERCSKETCEDCPYANEDIFDTSCGTNMAKDALALIKEITAEADKLGKALEKMSADHDRDIRLTEAYAVWKMHSMLCEGRVSNDTVVIVANQIANEMLKEISDEKSE